MSDTGKRNVRWSDPVAVLCRVRKSLLPLRGGGFGINVKRNGYCRIGKLHFRDVHNVAPEHHLLALAFDGIKAVSGSMTRSGD